MYNKLIYLTEIGQDIDDLIACLYLHSKGVLDCVVLDTKPKTKEEFERIDFLKNKGIEISYKIPNGTRYVFVGGRLTALADYLTKS